MEDVKVERYRKIKITVAPGKDNCNVLSRLCTPEAVASGDMDQTDTVMSVAVSLSEDGHYASAEEGALENIHELKTPKMEFSLCTQSGYLSLHNKTNDPVDLWFRFGVYNLHSMR